MSDKILKWLSNINAEKKRSDVLSSLDKHKEIANKLLDSKSPSNLNILIRALKLEPALVDLNKLESVCISSAPLLLDELRLVSGCDRNRVESNILKQLRPLECISKVCTWYQDAVPSTLQAVVGWKVYNQCYSELTTGQVSDRTLDNVTAATLLKSIELIPTVLNNPSAILNISKAAAYVMRNGDTSNFKENNLPINFNELALSAIWGYVDTIEDSFNKQKWVTHATSLTLNNNKLIPANLVWLQMHKPDVYNKIYTLENAEVKDISTYLSKMRKESGITEALLNKKHSDNSPGSLESYISI